MLEFVILLLNTFKFLNELKSNLSIKEKSKDYKRKWRKTTGFSPLPLFKGLIEQPQLQSNM